MPLKEFTEAAYTGLAAGKEQVPIGMAEPPFAEDGFEVKRQQAFRDMSEAMKQVMSQGD